jgi:hypothetical protein
LQGTLTASPNTKEESKRRREDIKPPFLSTLSLAFGSDTSKTKQLQTICDDLIRTNRCKNTKNTAKQSEACLKSRNQAAKAGDPIN